MSDKDFDDAIKGKVEGFEGPAFDPAALAAMHHKMGALVQVPWYVRFRSELFTAGVAAVVVLLIVWFQWYWFRLYQLERTEEMGNLKSQLARFEDQLAAMEKRKLSTTDTVVQYLNFPDQDYTQLKKELLASISQMVGKKGEVSALGKESKYGWFIGKLADLPFDLVKQLADKGYLKINDDDLYLVIPPNGGSDLATSGAGPFLFYEEVESPEIQPLAFREPEKAKKKKRPKIPLGLVNSLERHYWKGVGINAGLSVGGSLPFYEKGKGSAFISPGLNAELVFSPNWSLETGISYSRRGYSISENADLGWEAYPEVNSDFGTLEKVEVEVDAIELPIQLKYRFAVSPVTKLFTGIGYSSLFYASQEFEYHHRATDGALEGLSLRSGYRLSTMKPYSGSLQFSFGFQRKLNENRFFDASFHYQRGLGNIGIENNNVGYFGLRAAYWFMLR